MNGEVTDTLQVVLDASLLKGPRTPSGMPDTSLVEATGQCLLVNSATISRIKFVDLKVRGPLKYRKYGGVYATEPYRCGARKQQFP